MVDLHAEIEVSVAREMMDRFARDTGLMGTEGDLRRRYLWTDALAVQTFFGLSEACDEPEYSHLAVRLIDAVHTVLGRFRRDDERSGWISGLGEEEGARRPTMGGLRIGKKGPERSEGELVDEREEWDRDGQYFHYLTRWVMALLSAARATVDARYGIWAADLITAGTRFIDVQHDRLHMYWKMSTDLRRPLVLSQGAQDPLEGLLCAQATRLSRQGEVQDHVVESYAGLCSGRQWLTSDPLGLGGLLMHASWAEELAHQGAVLPPEAQAQRLLGEAVEGLAQYAHGRDVALSAGQRLAFRECGLSLGLHVASNQDAVGVFSTQLHPYESLADSIEEFWCEPINQRAVTWLGHQDINAVSLAASLTAKLNRKPFQLQASPD